MSINFKKYLKEFKKDTITMFKEFFIKETNKKQRANMWTFLRLIIPFITTTICIISIFVTYTLPLLLIATGLTGFAAVTDYLDGKSARKHNSTSDYGKLLDQVADKVFSGLTGISISIINPLFLILLVGEGIISAINITYKSQNPNLNITSTKIGRIKEWPLFITLGLGFISNLNPIINLITKIMIIITSTLQVITAISYIKQNEKEVNNLSNNKEIISNNTLNINIEEKGKEKIKVLDKNNKITELKNYKKELLENKDLKEEEKILILK